MCGHYSSTDIVALTIDLDQSFLESEGINSFRTSACLKHVVAAAPTATIEAIRTLIATFFDVGIKKGHKEEAK
jgi:hypothetical protein